MKSQPSLIFKDGSQIPGGLPNDIAGRTDGSFHSALFGGGLISATVYLNTDILSNSSKEYIAATIIHELMHAYFDSFVNSTTNHDQMATNYFNFMRATLEDLFPTLSDDEAKALTWGGLEKTVGYSSDVINNGLKTYYNTINNEFKNKSKGTGCN